jgi:hypothetical protein
MGPQSVKGSSNPSFKGFLCLAFIYLPLLLVAAVAAVVVVEVVVVEVVVVVVVVVPLADFL